MCETCSRIGSNGAHDSKRWEVVGIEELRNRVVEILAKRSKNATWPSF